MNETLLEEARRALAEHSSGVLVTGANGHLGSRLLRVLTSEAGPAAGPPVPPIKVRALVRSESAAARLTTLAPESVVVGSYTDPVAVQAALAGCDTVVHLVGIIKESRGNSFREAHVATTDAVVTAATAAGVRRIVYLSIVGADRASENPCLQTKGVAEQRLMGSPVPATAFRVPMVLGEGDYASRALRRRALARSTLVFRKESLEQPIYAGDLIAAICQALTRRDATDLLLSLPGPETLTREALIQRAALVFGRTVTVRSLPISLGMALAGVLARVSANPPVTRAMLGVLDHDDDASNGPALTELGLELTELDEVLRRCLEPA